MKTYIIKLILYILFISLISGILYSVFLLIGIFLNEQDINVKLIYFTLCSIIIILFLAWSYNNDIEIYEEVRTRPDVFCGQWCIVQEQIKLWNETGMDYHLHVTPDFDQLNKTVINIEFNQSD